MLLLLLLLLLLMWFEVCRLISRQIDFVVFMSVCSVVPVAFAVVVAFVV